MLKITTDASTTGWGMDARPTRSGVLDSANEPKTLKLQRTVCGFDGPSCIQGSNYSEVNANCAGQYYHGGLLYHLGGSTQQLSKIASAIRTFAYENNVSLSARKKNMLADYLSRLNPKYKWQLHPTIYTLLDKLSGPWIFLPQWQILSCHDSTAASQTH